MSASSTSPAIKRRTRKSGSSASASSASNCATSTAALSMAHWVLAGRLRTGGDGAAMSAQGSPPTEKLVAFFSGPLKLDAAGKATVDFDIPQFNGTVRVMSVAWTKDAVGHASTDVIVREPVVVTAGLPRFMAPGDTAQLRLDIANTDGPAGDYNLMVETDGKIKAGGGAPVPEKVTLDQGKRDTVVRADCGRRHRRRHDHRDAVACQRTGRRTGAVRAGAARRHAGHHAQCRQPCRQWRQPAGRPRAFGGEPARRRHRQRRRITFLGLRHTVAADDARPLSLWLRRADDEPRHAAALCQRTGKGSRHGGRSRVARSASSRRSTGCSTTRLRRAASASGRRVPAICGWTPMSATS